MSNAVICSCPSAPKTDIDKSITYKAIFSLSLQRTLRVGVLDSFRRSTAYPDNAPCDYDGHYSEEDEHLSKLAKPEMLKAIILIHCGGENGQ